MAMICTCPQTNIVNISLIASDGHFKHFTAFIYINACQKFNQAVITSGSFVMV